MGHLFKPPNVLPLPLDALGVLAAQLENIGNVSINIQPIPGKKQHAENQKRKERQYDRNRICSLYLAFVEFREDVKRRRLRPAGQIPRNQDRRSKLPDRASKSQQCAGDDRTP